MDEVLTEDAKILFKDLCVKYPYGIRGQVYLKVPRVIDWHLVQKELVIEVKLLGIQGESLIVAAVDENGDTIDNIFDERNIVEAYEVTCFNFKPYLRPISSMTREELKELRDIFNNIIDFDEWGLDILNSDFKRFSYLELLAIFDWFNKHHFDYGGLIEKGLAIKAPDGMYN